jgi:hypothetical protein
LADARFLGDLQFTYPTNASGTLWNNGHTIEFHTDTNLWSHISYERVHSKNMNVSFRCGFSDCGCYPRRTL